MAMEHNILMVLFSSQGSIDYPADFQVCLQYNLFCFKSNTAYFNIELCQLHCKRLRDVSLFFNPWREPINTTRYSQSWNEEHRNQKWPLQITKQKKTVPKTTCLLLQKIQKDGGGAIKPLQSMEINFAKCKRILC